MSWSNLSLVPTSSEWSYTEAFEGDRIRIRHILGAAPQDLPYGFTGLIAQAFDFSNTVELYKIRKLYPSNFEDIFSVVNPFPNRPRRLAIRGQRRYQTKISWIVSIDVWNDTEPSEIEIISQQIEAVEQRQLLQLSTINSKLDQLLNQNRGNSSSRGRGR